MTLMESKQPCLLNACKTPHLDILPYVECISNRSFLKILQFPFNQDMFFGGEGLQSLLLLPYTAAITIPPTYLTTIWVEAPFPEVLHRSPSALKCCGNP